MHELLTRLDAEDLRVATALLVLLVGYLFYRGVTRSLFRLVKLGQITEQMAGRLRTVLRLVFLLGTGTVALQQAGVFEHAMGVFAGIFATLAVGFFAMWSVLSNMVCALLILAFRPFQVGDEVEIVEGSQPLPRGRVLDMNLLFVTLEQEEDDVVVQTQIPNTLFFQKVVRRIAPRQPQSKSFYPGNTD